MGKDIVERLRSCASIGVSHPHFGGIADDCIEAADTITTLREQVAELESELEANAGMLARQCDLAREAEMQVATEKAKMVELREMASFDAAQVREWRRKSSRIYEMHEDELTQYDSFAGMLDDILATLDGDVEDTG